ncbi:MAG: N-acetylmuramoyl-L-alanine amidase [Candidatus Dormibacteria bacterium]
MSRPDYSGAQWVGSPNYWTGRTDVAAIVYHTEAGHEAGTEATFQQQGGTSAHYSVALDGQVHQYVQERDSAWHAGGNWPDGTNANLHTIGVEREDNVDPSTPMPPAQAAAWQALMGYLCDKYQVPRQVVGNGQRGLISHHLINPDHADCAGPAVEAVAQAFCQGGDVKTLDEKRAIVRGWFGTWLRREPESDDVLSGFANKIADDGSNLDEIEREISDSDEARRLRGEHV